MGKGDLAVTVVVPTRDRPLDLAAAIASARAQTFRPLEIVVVDDGSVPPVVLGEHAADDVRLLRLEAPVGPGAARNRGAELARGTVLAFLDDDDRWRPTMLEQTVGAMAGATVAVTARAEHHIAGRPFDIHAPAPDDQLYRALLRQPALVPSALVVRTDVFRALGGFDEELRYGEDWDLALRLVEAHPVAVLPEVLVDRQLHPDRHYGPRLVGDHREMMRRIAPRLRALPAGERLRIRTQHLQRLGQYGLRVALEPVVVGRKPWRARTALRQRLRARS